MSFAYICSPYTHDDPAVRLSRFHEAIRFLRWCFRRGDFAFSPIVHSHDVALDDALPHTFDFWEAYDRMMIRQSRGIYVLRIDGWEKSKGIAAELAYALEIGRPVTPFYLAGDGYTPNPTP